MKVLVVGSGGREHAICMSVAKVKKGRLRSTVHRAMPESVRYAECVPIGAMDFDKLVAFAKENAIDFYNHWYG